MAKSNDPLMESLMQMAVAAAPLIRKVRESGLFRDRDTVVEAEVVTPETAATPSAPEPPMPPPAAPPVNPDTGALQDIVVRQALRINELEAELAAMKAVAAHKATKAKPQPKPKPKVKARAKAAPAG